MIGYVVAFLIGTAFGATGTLIYIKETHLDAVLEREEANAVKVTVSVGGEKIDAISYEKQPCATEDFLVNPWESQTLDEIMTEDIKYGDF